MGRARKVIPARYVFRACEMFLREKQRGRRIGASEIAKWLQSENQSCSREQVYELLNDGIDIGYLKLCPPIEVSLSRQMARNFRFEEEQMQVLDVIGPSLEEHLAQAAAERIVERIGKLKEQNKDVHIGFGAGMTTYLVAGALARLLQYEPDLPQITIHALSSGFSLERPQTAPVAFFSFFDGLNPAVKFVGLFAPAVIDSDEYESIKEKLGVRESFAAAKEHMDIVVTSLAKKDDPDGQLNRFMRKAPEWGAAALEGAGWVGDIQWRPYSDLGPIEVDAAIRAVTIYELSELLELAGDPEKLVLVVCGRCNVCKDNKARALLPLLRTESLRVFNHLVTDRETAEKVLRLAKEIPGPLQNDN